MQINRNIKDALPISCYHSTKLFQCKHGFDEIIIQCGQGKNNKATEKLFKKKKMGQTKSIKGFEKMRN